MKKRSTAAGEDDRPASGMNEARDQGQAVQRVKVGLIGLATVVLLIILASAIMRTATRETPIATVGAPKADVVANLAVANQQQDMVEPLAELGVDPVNQQAAAPRAAH